MMISSSSDSNSMAEKNKQKQQPLSQELRVATRAIHDLSDTLVNLKLGVAMSEDSVWAEGLLVFYEIFRYLERAIKERLQVLHASSFPIIASIIIHLRLVNFVVSSHHYSFSLLE